MHSLKSYKKQYTTVGPYRLKVYEGLLAVQLLEHSIQRFSGYNALNLID